MFNFKQILVKCKWSYLSKVGWYSDDMTQGKQKRMCGIQCRTFLDSNRALNMGGGHSWNRPQTFVLRKRSTLWISNLPFLDFLQKVRTSSSRYSPRSTFPRNAFEYCPLLIDHNRVIFVKFASFFDIALSISHRVWQGGVGRDNSERLFLSLSLIMAPTQTHLPTVINL